jgi:uncharacterized DUF497 family protein
MDCGPIFEWDEGKRCRNLRKHGLDFADCATVFAGPVTSVVDDRNDYGEMRFASTGLLRGRVVVVAHTDERGVIRVISMRKATAHEQKAYLEDTFPD